VLHQGSDINGLVHQFKTIVGGGRMDH
jgi:hypothetical protein